MDPENKTEWNDELPWEDVEASRRDKRLQRRHPLSKALSHQTTAKPCPKCGAVPEDLAWFYFESPAETWDWMCGRAGWISVCDPCHLQVEFFIEVMN